MSTKVAKLIAEHNKICHIEFNVRQYSIRKALKIVAKARLGPIIDIITDSKVHCIIVADCYECVNMRSKIIGMRVYDHFNLELDDKPIGVKIIRLKDIQYFNPETAKEHCEFMIDKMAKKPFVDVLCKHKVNAAKCDECLINHEHMPQVELKIKSYEQCLHGWNAAKCDDCLVNHYKLKCKHNILNDPLSGCQECLANY